MGEYRRLYPAVQGAAELLQRIVPVEEPPPGDLELRPQGVQRPHHRVVLKAGDRHLRPRRHQGMDGNVQPVGAAGGEHHLLRAAAEEFSRRLPAGEHRLRSLLRRRVSAPARTGAAAHGAFHRPVDALGLVEGGSAVIQVDHSAVSSSFPSSPRRYTLPMGSCSARSSPAACSMLAVCTRRL